MDVIIPIPLHPLKLQHRGFNQAAELAHFISRKMVIDVRYDILQRTDATHQQQESDRRSRLSNMKNAFTVQTAPPCRVAIIDDVVTTGATIEAAASSLKKAGAEYVEIWAIARTPKRQFS